MPRPTRVPALTSPPYVSSVPRHGADVSIRNIRHACAGVAPAGPGAAPPRADTRARRLRRTRRHGSGAPAVACVTRVDSSSPAGRQAPPRLPPHVASTPVVAPGATWPNRDRPQARPRQPARVVAGDRPARRPAVPVAPSPQRSAACAARSAPGTPTWRRSPRSRARRRHPLGSRGTPSPPRDARRRWGGGLPHSGVPPVPPWRQRQRTGHTPARLPLVCHAGNTARSICSGYRDQPVYPGAARVHTRCLVRLRHGCGVSGGCTRASGILCASRIWR